MRQACRRLGGGAAAAPALAGLLLFVHASPAGAEVILKGIRWHMQVKDGKMKVYREIEGWSQAPAPRLAAKPRAVVTLANRGPKPADGVLLSYAVSARLVRIGAAGEGVWTVPFWTEERRITPRMKPNETRDIAIDSMRLQIYLLRVFRAGFWPDAIKIQVMVEPRGGESLEQRIKERMLPVAGAAAGP